MAKRINPAKQLLWRNASDIQIGLTEPVILTDVTTEDERLLALLQRGLPDDAVTEGQIPLLERLGPALIEFGQAKKPRLSHEFMRGAFDELIRASFTTGRDGVSVLEHRATQTIRLESLGRGGLLVALGLASAGVGRILVDEDSGVSDLEVYPLGFRAEQVGRSRLQATRDLLSERNSQTSVEASAAQTPAKLRSTLSVLIGGNAMDPRRYAALLRQRQPHIGVFFETENVSVSPVITSSPCLDCLNRYREDADSAWPAIAAQLAGTREYLEDAKSAMFAAAMVVGEILRAIDSPRAEGDFVGHRLSVASGRVSEWTWSAHPKCDCYADAA